MNFSPYSLAYLIFVAYVTMGFVVDCLLSWSPKDSSPRNVNQPIVVILTWPVYFRVFLKLLKIYLFEYIPLLVRRWFCGFRMKLLKKQRERSTKEAIKLILFSGKFGICPQCKAVIRRKDFARLRCKKCKRAKYQPFEKFCNKKDINGLEFDEVFIKRIRKLITGK